mmetsp:Transcript_5943/g.13026  ORF Transcript_5943/g.13026 Transcript_5943/m.13026 type:complete len:108 (-) Transcript_5943:426-749(-)
MQSLSQGHCLMRLFAQMPQAYNRQRRLQPTYDSSTSPDGHQPHQEDMQQHLACDPPAADSRDAPSAVLADSLPAAAARPIQTWLQQTTCWSGCSQHAWWYSASRAQP